MMKKQISSMLIAVCMVFTMLPTTAFAAEGSTPIGTSNVTDSGTPAACPHTGHDETCGFIEAVEGVACAHLNEDGTYSCAPVLDVSEGEASPSDAAYVCDHEDGCGFTEVVAGSLCTHACELCKPVGEDNILSPAEDCDCTVKCIAADEANEIEAAINPDCPVCGAEGADLAQCKGEAPALLVAPRAGNAVELTNKQGAVTTYASIEEAFADERKEGDVVKLLENVTLTKDLDVKVEKKNSSKVLLDLNGKTLDCDSHAIVVNENILGIENNAAAVGKVSGTNAEEVILVNNGTYLSLYANVTVENTGTGSAIHSNLGGDITVNAATVTAKKNYAIQNYGKVAVYSGVITSGSKAAIFSEGPTDNEDAGFVMISGGSVKGVDHTNGKPVMSWGGVGVGFVPVQSYVFKIQGEANRPITSLETVPATDGYGTGGVVTDSEGTIYAWLAPDRTKVIIKIGEETYSAAINSETGGAELEKEETTPPPTTGGGSSSDGGSSSSSTVTPPASSSNVESKGDGKVIASKVADETAKAIAEAKKSGTGTEANIVAVNPVYVAPQTLQDMAAAAQKAGGTAWLFADSVVDKKVMVRIYINTANAQSFKENILLGGTVSGKAVDYTQKKFASFDNRLAVVSLAQQKPFAVSTEIAAKVDLTGLDTKTLFFYSFDRATNKCYPISAPSYRMDKSGYLHFNTTRAGDIVITDKPLTLKK